jgi:hypothetical protein
MLTTKIQSKAPNPCRPRVRLKDITTWLTGYDAYRRILGAPHRSNVESPQDAHL